MWLLLPLGCSFKFSSVFKLIYIHLLIQIKALLQSRAKVTGIFGFFFKKE